MITKKDRYFFDLAEKVSYTSDFSRVKIGSVIVRKNRVVSMGSNQLKSHPLQKKYNRYRDFESMSDFLHSELHAIINSGEDDLSDCKIYVSRRQKGKQNMLGCCCPCAACQKALRDYGIKEVYYTDCDGYHKIVLEY